MAPRQHFFAGGFAERPGRIHHFGAEKRSDAGAADPGCSTHGQPAATFRNRRSTVIASSGRPAAKTAAALPRGRWTAACGERAEIPAMTFLRRGSRSALVAITLFALAACDSPLPPPALTPLETPSALQPAAPRTNSTISQTADKRLYSKPAAFRACLSCPPPPTASTTAIESGDVTLNFVDTDVREIARVILGGMLKVNYTIDPAVQGTATLDIGRPLSRSALLPALETLLNQNGATLIARDGIYNVVPLAAGAVSGTVSAAETVDRALRSCPCDTPRRKTS